MLFFPVACSFFFRRPKLLRQSGMTWVKPSTLWGQSSVLLLQPLSPHSWTDKRTGETDTSMRAYMRTQKPSHRNSLSSSWAEVLGSLGQQLQRSQEVLLLWDTYVHLAGSLSEQLQTLQRDVTSELNVAPGQESAVEQVTVKLLKVQVRWTE